jgi:hypothetical protein
MTEQIKKINNPLTIIAVFAALAEVSATVAIGLINKDLHYIFIWFIIGFPSLLVILFFVTLNFNTKVLYSPSDYREDKAFMDTLYGSTNTKQKTYPVKSELTIEALTEFEEKLIKSMEEKISNIPNTPDTESIKKLIEEYKNEIKQISEEAISENEEIDLKLPIALKQAIVQWISYPAFIPIIYAIQKENSNSTKDLEKVKSKYNFTRFWDKSGIKGLLNSEILIGNSEEFEIRPSLKNELVKWININEPTITCIIENYGEYESKGKEWVSNQNNKLTQNLKI